MDFIRKKSTFNEIGSDFNTTDFALSNAFNIYNFLSAYNCVFFDSGRSAIKQVVKICNPKVVLMPNYICESVYNNFCECSIIYYNILNDFTIDWDDLLSKINNKIDMIYIYFFNGIISAKYDFDKLKDLKNKFKFTILEDTTHSIFSNVNVIGDFCICSLRKWFPIPDGGVLYSNENLLIEKPYKINKWVEKKKKAMDIKLDYIEGKTIDKKIYLSLFNESEQNLDNQKEIYCISEYSSNLLKYIDINNMIKIRKKNFNILNKYFKDKFGFSFDIKEQVPLFYTLILNNRDQIREMLIKEKIYCPVHWPLCNNNMYDKSAIFLYSHELSIPIDQRYCEKDMKKIINIISDIIGGI